ncbi:bud site selection protein [Anaeramoeba ignava]|uniref:Bud site selection protein n=1 Tax=Anaeramoeba ignava TaxID=1746090 RepID=A0A9Q0R561_ANAIG|nr:bud site selection protein [Anaeramoeba ignava]
MSDILSLTHEGEEGVFGESLLARQIQLKLTKTGLGPPDLCHVTKTESYNRKKKTKANQKAHKVVGFYHYVIGVDTSNISSIAKYLNLLLRSQENAGFLKKKWSVVSCSYYSFNAFSKLDLHIHFTLPNKLQFFFIDRNGSCIDAEPHITNIVSSSSNTKLNHLENSEKNNSHSQRRDSRNKKFERNQMKSFSGNEMNNLNGNSNGNENSNENQNENLNSNQNENQNLNSNQNENIKNNNNINNIIIIDNINPNQQKKEATIWDETFISSFFRKVIAQYINAYTKIPIIHIVENQIDNDNENQLFNLLAAVFWKGKKLGCSQSRIIPSNAYNFYIKLTQKYLFGQYRFTFAIKFFSQFLEQEPEVAIPISKAYLKLKDVKNALLVLMNGYNRKISSVPLISQLIKTLLVSNKIAKAVKLARHLTSIVPFYPKPYLLLAKAYLKQKNFHSVLVNINSIPFQTNNACSRNSIICLDGMFPTPSRITIPNLPKFRSNFEHLFSQSFEDMDFLKRSGKIPEIKEKIKSKFSDLPSLALKNSLEKKIYKILIDFSNEYGWERMMESRVEVFQKNIRSLVGNKKKKRVPFGEGIEYDFGNLAEITPNEKNELVEVIEENERKLLQKAKNTKNTDLQYLKTHQILEKKFADKKNKLSQKSNLNNQKNELKQNQNMDEILSTLTSPEISFSKNFWKENAIEANFADDSSEYLWENTKKVDQEKASQRISKLRSAPETQIKPYYVRIEYQKWLDTLIQYLYLDLKCFNTYLKNEEKAKKDSDNESEIEKYSYMDYDLIGDLASKLRSFRIAKNCYILAIQFSGNRIKKVNRKICLKLLEMNIKRGTLNEVLVTSNRLLYYLDKKIIPYEEEFLFKNTISKCIFKLIFRNGLISLNSFISKRFNEKDNKIHPKLKELIEKAKKLQIDGIER